VRKNAGCWFSLYNWNEQKPENQVQQQIFAKSEAIFWGTQFKKLRLDSSCTREQIMEMRFARCPANLVNAGWSWRAVPAVSGCNLET